MRIILAISAWFLSGSVLLADESYGFTFSPPIRPTNVPASTIDLAPSAIGWTYISGVPTYRWNHGCTPTSCGMVIGYYATHGFPDLMDGPAEAESLPVSNNIASAGSWVLGFGPQLNYEDYGLPYDYDLEYPFVLSDRSDSHSYPTNCHAENSIADFIRTSRSVDLNTYGATWFTNISPGVSNYVTFRNPKYHMVSVLYGYSDSLWSVLVDQVGKNQPMILGVDSDADGNADHNVCAFGYGTDGALQYYLFYDTWDNLTHYVRFLPVASGRSFGVYNGNTFKFTP